MKQGSQGGGDGEPMEEEMQWNWNLSLLRSAGRSPEAKWYSGWLARGGWRDTKTSDRRTGSGPV
uniref:Uncharacterized protein n=1 Tax=Arundo donax TaxID=35708 RepID=A0A0A9MW57_ARUDO